MMSEQFNKGKQLIVAIILGILTVKSDVRLTAMLTILISTS
jgi:hypothetical protein